MSKNKNKSKWGMVIKAGETHIVNNPEPIKGAENPITLEVSPIPEDANLDLAKVRKHEYLDLVNKYWDKIAEEHIAISSQLIQIKREIMLMSDKLDKDREEKKNVGASVAIWTMIVLTLGIVIGQWI